MSEAAMKTLGRVRDEASSTRRVSMLVPSVSEYLPNKVKESMPKVRVQGTY